MEEEEEEEEQRGGGGALQSEASLCHPLCQCPTCAPTQKVTRQRPSSSGVGGRRGSNPRCPLCVPQLSVLQAGALGVNSCNGGGFTPLHVAALHGHCPLAALLIRHGANVNARTNHSATPLHLASQNSHVQVGVGGASEEHLFIAT